MAEIHVQPKKKTTPVWVWLLIALLVLGVIAFILLRNRKTDQTNTVNSPARTSFVEIQDSQPALPEKI
jgi:hypothetical protein